MTPAAQPWDERPRASCLPGNAQLCQLHVEPEPLIVPKTALTNCSGNPRRFGVCAASGEGRGPGGCPPGIIQPTVVPTVGTGAWQYARKLGSHDERLGGESVKSLKSSVGTSCYRLQRLPQQGWSVIGCRFWVWGGGSLFEHDRAPFPAAFKLCWQTHSFYPPNNLFALE